MKKICSPKKLALWISIAVVVATAITLCLVFVPRKPNVPSALDACVVSTLREVHHSSHTTGKYPAVTYTALATKEKRGTVTVYGVMLYREYTATVQNKLEIWGAAHYPFAITAMENADGTYTATDCWWPSNGADHVPSIRKKFPSYCQRKAVNYRDFYAEQSAHCDAQAAQNIADEDKYVVMESDNENVRLAYCDSVSTSYLVFSGGYTADGTYAVEGDQAIFTFGSRKLVFEIDDDELVYDAKSSANIPAIWAESGSVKYLTDGVRFTLDDGLGNPIAEKTAPVGATVTVINHNWMKEEELREMFGQYVPSTYFESDNPKYLPVRPIESRGQLDLFVEAYGDSWSGLTAEAFAPFDEAFFENNYLLMTYYKNGLASAQPKIDSYVYVEDGTSLWMSVRLEVVQPTGGDAVVGQWLLFSGIAKEDYKKSTGLEAYVENVVAETNADFASDFTLTGTVKEVDGRAMLLECVGDSQFTTVWVELGDIELDPAVGETYTVTYEDIVMPSLPPRITAVTITKN